MFIMALPLLLCLTAVMVAAETDRLARHLRRYDLSKSAIFDIARRTPKTAQHTPDVASRSAGVNIATEVEWAKKAFPGGFKDLTGSARCPADGCECYEVIVAVGGSNLDAGKKRLAISRWRTAINPDYRKKAKHEVTVFFQVPDRYPSQPVQLRITDSNGFLNKEKHALQTALRKIATQHQRRSQPSMKAICRRALRFVSDGGDRLRTRPVNLWWLVAIGFALLLLVKYVHWRLEHTTTVYHR